MSQDLLAGLTADRLDELAAGENNVADQLEAQADAEAVSQPGLAGAYREDALVHRQLAAVCEAVAKAERAMQESSDQIGVVGTVDALGVERYEPHPSVVRSFTQHSTLAAALGAVGDAP